MFQFQLGEEFKTDAHRRVRQFAPLTGRISQDILARARTVVIGGVAGWAAVVIAGAVLMANAQPGCCKVDSAVAAAPAAQPGASELAAADAPPPPQVAPAPAPPPAPVAAIKSMQRIDMTPTSGIPSDRAAKPKPKPHKKKKHLDKRQRGGG